MIEQVRLPRPCPPAAVQMADDQTAKKVRGRPFEPGNPGRPPGSKNKTTLMVDQLLASEAETLTRTYIEAALAGDRGCLRDALNRLSPRRKSRPIDFTLPTIKNPADAVTAMAAIATGVADGSLTAEEAGQLVHFVEVYLKAIDAHDLAVRLEELKSRVEKKNKS